MVSERAKAGIAAGGGRHYSGGGLGTLKGWRCVACGQENAGAFKDGCINCSAGAPGTQVRKPGDAIVDGGAKVAEIKPARAAPLPSVLRIPAPKAAIDYDEVERRVARVIEQRLGGGFTDAERTTLYNALTVYLGAWEDGLIEPDTGLNLEKTRELAAKVSPDEMPAIEAATEEAETAHDDTSSTSSTPTPAPISAPQLDELDEPGGIVDHTPDGDDVYDTGLTVIVDDGSRPTTIVQRVKPPQ